MTMSRILARPMLTSIFVIGPAKTLQDPKPAAERADRVTRPVVAGLRKLGLQVPEDPLFWVRLNAGVQLVAAAGLATGKMPRVSAAVLATSLVPTTLAAHDFWNESDPAVRNQQLIQWAKNMSLLGGLVIAANDTNGRPGAAWLARHALHDAQREAAHAAGTAKLEAKIAALDAGVGAGVLGTAIAAAGRHAKETLQQAATSDTAQRIAERATELASTAKEQAPVVAAAAREHLATVADTAKEQAPVVAAAAREQLATLAESARDEAEPIAKDLRKQARSTAKDARKSYRKVSKEARKSYRRQRKHLSDQVADIRGR